MKFFNFLKRLVKSNDFFFSSQMLRYDDELQYKTLTGGIISLGIIITIIVGFASMIIDTFQMNTILTKVEVKKNSNPTYSKISTNPQDSMFMFGLQVSGTDLTGTQQYFETIFTYQQLNFGIHTKHVELALQPCTKAHWRNYPEIQKGYDVSNMPKWLCPPMNISLQLYGKFTSEHSTQYEVEIRGCRNKTNSTKICHSQQKIAEFFKQNNNFLYFTIYYTNLIINPSQKQYMHYYLDDMNYVVFGSTFGSENYLYFTDYTILTDNSIWPFKNIQKEAGTIVQQNSLNHPFQTTIKDSLIKFYFAKSPDSIIYNREIQKLSTVISFLGGTIGALSAVLFIIKMYTNFSFEIAIAFSIFQRETGKIQGQKQGHTSLKELNINFLDFFKFFVFNICNFFNNRMDWPMAQYIGKCEKEISKQLDIKSLLKRIIFLQYCMTYTFEDYQLEGLQIRRPRTLEEIKQVRQKCISIMSNSQQKCSASNLAQKEQAEQQKQVQKMKQSEMQLFNLQQHMDLQRQRQYNDIKNQVNSHQSNFQCLKQDLTMNHHEKIPKKKNQFFQKKPIEKVNEDNFVHNLQQIEEQRQRILYILKKKAKTGEKISKKILQRIEDHRLNTISRSQAQF